MNMFKVMMTGNGLRVHPCGMPEVASWGLYRGYIIWTMYWGLYGGIQGVYGDYIG